MHVFFINILTRCKGLSLLHIEHDDWQLQGPIMLSLPVMHPVTMATMSVIPSAIAWGAIHQFLRIIRNFDS
jgi:hypothetical protein